MMKRFSSLLSQTFFLASIVLSANTFAQADAAQEGAAAPAAEKTEAEKLAENPPQNRLNLSAEALAAKAHLEAVLANRYIKDLSTILSEDDFRVSVFLNLRQAPKKAPEADRKEDLNGLPLDLQVGYFDPAVLVQKYVDKDEQEQIISFLTQYSISEVKMAVGVDPQVPALEKENLETWLKLRLASEFGNIGSYQLNSVGKKTPKLTETMGTLQTLFGALAIALAIIMGAFMWKSSQPSAGERMAAAGVAPSVEGAQAQKNDNSGKMETESKASEAEEIRTARELREYSDKISELSSQIRESSADIVRSWCEKGEKGYLKVACFAEAVGKSFGVLPIPPESSKEVGEVFSKMPATNNDQKLELLAEIYWDLVSAVNLGSQTLSQPFSYLATSDADMLQQVLLEENEKLKTLVGIHMPLGLRKTYMSSLDNAAKASLLNEAANLSAIPEAEYRKVNDDFKARLSGGSVSDNVAFDMAFEKIVEGLNLQEEMELLPTIDGAGVESFKVRVPSLAFVHEWPDDKLGLLFGQAMPQEVLAYIRCKLSEKDRVLALCPDMTAAVVGDELQRSDEASEEELLQGLESLFGRVTQLVQNGEVKLKTIYDKMNSDDLKVA